MICSIDYEKVDSGEMLYDDYQASQGLALLAKGKVSLEEMLKALMDCYGSNPYVAIIMGLVNQEYWLNRDIHVPH